MNTLECLRRSRLVPALTLAAFLVPMVPRVARADDPSPPPVNLSAPSSPSTLGATETSPAGVNGLASATVDPSTGVLHTTIPFALPAARGAVQPRLALTYSSSGAFGVGRTILPALGQEGELLAAWGAARIITRTDRRKEQMRREMWSKVELG